MKEIVRYRVRFGQSTTISTIAGFNDVLSSAQGNEPTGIIITNAGAIENVFVNGKTVPPGESWTLNAPDPFGQVDLRSLKLTWPGGATSTEIQMYWCEEFKTQIIK